jgi:hypothetical protein
MTAIGQAAPDLVLTLDLAVRRPPGRTTRLHARHGVAGDRVTAVSTAFTGEVEVARLTLEAWPDELARRITVPAPEPGPASVPAPGLLLPWDLLVGTGAARARGRGDLYDALVARGVASSRTDGGALDLAGCHEQLRRLHGAAGRLRAAAAGVRPAHGPRIGWVSWVLLGDRWYALTPTVVDHRPMVRVDPRRTGALGREAAVWLAAVRR